VSSHENTYAITYWFAGAGWGGQGVGIEVVEAENAMSAALELARRISPLQPSFQPDHYELLSVIQVDRDDLKVEAVNVERRHASRTVALNVSGAPIDGAWQAAGKVDGNPMFAITGLVGDDQYRFVQILEAPTLLVAMEMVDDYMDAFEHVDEVEFWSAVELLEEGHYKIWWLARDWFEDVEPKLILERGAVDTGDAPSPSSARVDEALEAINRHRQSLWMEPLDPVASGWTDEDVIQRASEIERLPNPLVELKRHLLSR